MDTPFCTFAGYITCTEYVASYYYSYKQHVASYLLFIVPPSIASSDDIRMIRTQVAGRVEVYVEKEWRAVCHANWDENDARVACRQLGFSDKGT